VVILAVPINQRNCAFYCSPLSSAMLTRNVMPVGTLPARSHLRSATVLHACGLFDAPRTKTSYYDRLAFSVAGPVETNDLPLSIKNALIVHDNV
jgi:hypothetical protein